MLRRMHLIAILLIISLTITACLNAQKQTILPTPDSNLYAVDPVFREFYNVMGGIDVLGEVISPVQTSGGITSQFTVGGQMIFDPQSPATNRFQLGALGYKLGLGIPSGARYEIAEQFKPLYDQLGGELFIGKPLTDLVYNEKNRRSEQYFENLGFYLGPETDGTVRLLPYGIWQCSDECRGEMPLNAIPSMPMPTKLSATQVPFATPIPVSTPHRWVLQVWENSLKVSGVSQEEIILGILRDGLPFEGGAATIVIELPDGTLRSDEFPATDAQGMTRLEIDPTGVPNGTLIKYQVCIANEDGDSYCLQQSFLVWNAP